MKLFALLLSILFSLNLSAQTHEWVNSFGSTGFDRNYKLTLTPNNELVTVGYYTGTVDFDPGTSINSASSNGNKDVVICSYNTSGSFLWKKTYGGTGEDFGYDISSDLDGNLYVTGEFSNTVDFDPSSTTLNKSSNGGFDIFISKMDSAGNLIWSKTFGGTSDDRGMIVKTTKKNEVLITGYYKGTVDFDPGAGVINRTSNGGEDIFLCKLDSSGNFLWVNTYGSSSGSYRERGRGIELDDNDNIYLSGHFVGTVDFDAGAGTTNLTSNGAEDSFFTKLDSNGALIWAKSWGSSGGDFATSLSKSNKDNFFIGGLFYGTVDFDPSSSIVNKSSNGSADIFILKFDLSGNFDWVRTIGSASYDVSASLTNDQNENVIFTGFFNNTMDCDPDSGVANISATGLDDGYTCQFTSNGDYVWAFPINSSPNNGITQGVVSDKLGNLYMVGAFSGNNSDFDPQSTTTTLSSSGGLDAFIHKINDCKQSFDTLFEQACNSYTSPSGLYTWTSNGTYSDTVLNQFGCDSILTINLFVTKSEKTLNPISCSTYTSPSGIHTWDSTGTYMDTTQNGLGCDSVFTINLTIIDLDTSFTVLACKTYLSPSGKTNWNSSGIYQDTVLSSRGCDSVITVTLALVQPDTSISANDPVLTSNANGNVSYQWLDCNNSYSKIIGDTSSIFNATSNGTFSVEVDKNGCKDTSSCYQILTIGISETSANDKSVTVFPNPNKGSFRIELPKSYLSTSTQYKLMDIQGNCILTGSISKNNSTIYNNELAKGIYFLELIFNDGGTVIKKVVVK